jgi:hypothetical protein
MTYASGGLIQASDYNTMRDTLNNVWYVGNGDSGYGQSNLPSVTGGNVITATEWATLINVLNNARLHQSGTSTGISPPTASTVITYLSTLSSEITARVTNRAAYASQGATTSLGTKSSSIVLGATAGGSGQINSIVTFGSANAARYFFNAGGRIQFVCTATDNAATARSIAARADWAALTVTVANTSNSITAVGYRGLSTIASLVSTTASAAPYASTSASQWIYSSLIDTTNGSNGATVNHQATVTVPADDAFGGAVNVTLYVTAYAIYPETTYLGNAWGTPVLT